jgi:hypothetical protein
MNPSSAAPPGPKRALSLWCRFRGHEPLTDPAERAEARPAMVRGAARQFSRCRRCGAEITRGRTLAWRALAEGERIVRTEEGLPRLLKG